MKPDLEGRGFTTVLFLCATLVAGVASAQGNVPLLAGVAYAQAGAPEPAPAEATQEAEAPSVGATHEALRAVRDGMLAAWERRDLDALLSNVDPDVVVTWQNGEVSRGPEAIRAFYEKMFGPDNPVLVDITSKLEVDTLSILHGADTAIAFGSIHDVITFQRPPVAAPIIGASNQIEMDSRWSATLVRKDGAWKLASYHVSANVFDNPLMDLAVKAARRLGAIAGFVLGVVAVLLVVWARRAWPRKVIAGS